MLWPFYSLRFTSCSAQLPKSTAKIKTLPKGSQPSPSDIAHSKAEYTKILKTWKNCNHLAAEKKASVAQRLPEIRQRTVASSSPSFSLKTSPHSQPTYIGLLDRGRAFNFLRRSSKQRLEELRDRGYQKFLSDAK
jgi:hypothetical protein